MIYFFKRDFLAAQNIVLAVAILLAFYFLAGAINATSKTWSLQTKLNALLAQEDLTKIEVEKLKLEKQYYQTDEYQELMARKKLGKMAAGETMVILEPNSKAASENTLMIKILKNKNAVILHSGLIWFSRFSYFYSE